MPKVIDACGKAGDSEMAMCIFRRMQARGIQPHVVTYSALARPFAYKGHWQEVEEPKNIAAYRSLDFQLPTFF